MNRIAAVVPLPGLLLSGWRDTSTTVDPDPDTKLDEIKVVPIIATGVASDEFDVTAVQIVDVNDPDLLVPRRRQSVIASDLEPTNGDLLVFSLREVSNADAECGLADFDTSHEVASSPGGVWSKSELFKHQGPARSRHPRARIETFSDPPP